MAKYLAACKEVNGKIYVTRLAQSVGNPPTPGLPEPWAYVGPGTRPSIQEYSGDQFILVFEYLSHMVARVLDITVWPPNQVDPIITTPIIAIGTGNPPQGPDDAMFVRLSSATGRGQASAWYPGPQIQATPVIKNGNQYSVTITTQPGWSSGVPYTNYYRVYRQPLVGGSWTMVQDWVVAPLNFTDTQTGVLQFNYRATVGAGFDPNFPNDPTKYFEGDPGNIISRDSTAHPLDYQLVGDDPVNWSRNALQMQALATFGTRQQYLVEAVFDVVDYKFGSAEGQATAYWDATRKSYIVFTLNPTTYTPPDDVVDFKVSGVQNQAKMATGPRLDQ